MRILCGISSGANVVGSLRYAAQPGNEGKTVVTVICDSGSLYWQTSLFEHLGYEGSDDVGA